MDERHSYQNYEYEYTDGRGVSFLGSSLHPSDKEAISYFRSLEENGGIRMQRLKNATGRTIYTGFSSNSRRLTP
jgi:hypothetical protein